MSDYEVMSFGPRSAEVIAALGTSIYAPSSPTTQMIHRNPSTNA